MNSHREIERKFLVTGGAWQQTEIVQQIRQGYLSTTKERVVRVRVKDELATLTVKGITQNASRIECEYDIPLDDANLMLDDLCQKPLIEKTRYRLLVKNREWIVDEFHGENSGLVVAEVELNELDENIIIPDWAVVEITGDSRYYNSNLVTNPYRNWNE